jgi:hypothetical protein
MDAPLLNSDILASPFRARQPPEDFTYLPWQGSIPNVLALSLIFQGFAGKSIKATKSANNVYTLSHYIYIYINLQKKTCKNRGILGGLEHQSFFFMKISTILPYLSI